MGYGLISINLAIFAAVAVFVVSTRPNASDLTPSVSLAVAKQDSVDPLDTLSSADIAVNIAQLTRMEETTALINDADSRTHELAIASTDSQIIAKPQIVDTDIKSIKDVGTYVVVGGDTLDSLAQKFGVTSDSIRWSNNMVSSRLEVGKEIVVPPTNGFLYTVKSGDSAQSLSSRFSANKDKLVAFNDTEITGLVEGSKIFIPGGKKITPRAAPVYNFRAAAYGYNGYEFGNCTYYVANSISVPTGWGNANTWDNRAAFTPGWGVINHPGVSEVPAGAILVSNSGYYGHVALVEKVLPDGSLFISEMNYRGWNVTSTRIVPVSAIGAYNYIIRL